MAAPALQEAGVDYVALANNHAFDALKPGLEDTIDALDRAGLQFSGAGLASDEAWTPAYITRGDVTVAFISCTTLGGGKYDLDWSADRGQSRTHTIADDGDELRFSGSTGVAEAAEERLTTAVKWAASEADIVVVQIHGGQEFQPAPAPEIVRLVETASAAGADVIANHHPHVTSGLDIHDGTLVAWSLGNLFFDQDLWETFRSYLLTIHVTTSGIERAYVEPILIDGYVPKGVTGDPRRSLIRETASRSTTEFTVAGGELEGIADQARTRTRATETLTGDDQIFVRESGWLDEIKHNQGTIRVGVDRLITGGFDDAVVDGNRVAGPLWRFDQAQYIKGANIGIEGGGVELTRENANTKNTVLSPTHRIPLGNSDLTFMGRYKTPADSGLEVRVDWYDGLDVYRGQPAGRDPFRTETVDLPETGSHWEWTKVELHAPEGARYIDFELVLVPSEDQSVRQAWIDNLKLIEWTTDIVHKRVYDHLYLDGSATIQFNLSKLDDQERDIEWKSIDE